MQTKEIQKSQYKWIPQYHFEVEYTGPIILYYNIIDTSISNILSFKLTTYILYNIIILLVYNLIEYRENTSIGGKVENTSVGGKWGNMQ
jgi:hypothetical protein